MATVDSLDIKIQSEAKSAEKALDSLIKKLGSVTSAMSKTLNSKGLDGLGKSMESASAKMESLKKDMDGVAKSIEEPIKKAENALSELSEKYKDLGKEFQFFGDEKQLQSQLQKYRNLLEKAKLGEEKLRLGGDEGSSKYEKAVADLMQYSNIVERISKQLSKISTDSVGEIKIQGATADKDGVSESIDKTVQKLKWYNDYLAEFSERVSSITAGSPIIGTAGIEDVLNRLKKEIPDAVDLIESYEAELERLNDIKVEMKNITPPKADLESFDKTSDEIEEKIEGLLKKFRDVGIDFDFSGSQKELEKLVDSTIVKLNKLYERQDKAISLGKIDTSSFESLQYDIAKANNELDRMKEILRGMQGTQEIKINLLNQSTVKALEDFEEAFQRYKGIVESGGIESESGTYMPISGLAMSLEQLREQFPDAISLIRQFEELLSSINTRDSLGQIWEGAEIPDSLSKGIDDVREKMENIGDTAKETAEITRDFEDVLNSLQIPDIRETNLDKLQSKLRNAEEQIEKFNYELEKGMRFGDIDVDDKSFRKLTIKIREAELTADALKQKIREVSAESENAAEESAAAFQDKLANLQIPEIKTNSLEKLQKMLEKAEADLEKFQTKLENDITMGRITADFEDSGYRKAVEQIALTEKQIEAIKEKMKTASSAAGKTEGYRNLSKAVSTLAVPFNKLDSVLTKVTKGIVKFASSAKKMISAGIKNLGAEVKNTFGNLSKLASAFAKMNKASRSTDKSLSDSIKTMLKYTLSIRSMFMLVRKMKDAFKEGMNNLVQYSAEVNHGVSLMTSGLLSLKNGLAVAFSPIVNVIAPYIDMFVDKILSAVNAIGRFFAALTGKSIATQAKKVYQDYAESLNGVADAAKDAAKAVGTIGIDELNILSENKSNENAGAGIEDMFEDVAIEKDISDWAKRIRDAFLAEDWEELGKTLAELVNAGLRKIYDAIIDITPKVEQALKNFAKVFNAFVEYLDWELLGRTIGAGINLITTSINALLGDEGIDFENLGRKLSVGFRGMVDEIDWTGLGNAIGNWFMVSWRIADGFIEDMWRVSADTMRNGWEELGIAVGEAVNGVFDRINFEQIARVLTEGFRGILEAAANALDTIKFDVIAEKINSGLEVLANGLAWEHIGEQITKFTAAISKAFNDLLGLDFGIVGEIIGNGITDIVRAFNQLTGENGINFELLGANIADGLRNLFASIPWEEFGNALGNGFMLGWRVLDGFITGMAQENDAGLTGWAELGISIGNAINGIFEKIDFGAIGTLLSDAFNGLIDVIRNVIATVDWNGIAANLTQGLNNFIHGVDWAGAGATLSDLVMKLLNVFWEVAQNTDWESFGRGIGEFLSNIDWFGIIGKVFDIIWEVFSGFISGLFDTKAGKVIIGITAGMAALKIAFKGVEAILAAKEFVENAKIVFNLLPDGIKNIAPKVVSKLTEIGTGLIEKAIPLIETGVSKIVGEGGLFSKILTGASGLVSKIGPVLSSIGSVIFSPTGLLIAGIAAGVILIIANWDKIKEAAGKVKDWVVEKWEGIKEKTSEIWGNIQDFLGKTWDNIKGWASEKFENIGKAISESWSRIKENAQDIWGNIKNFLGETWDGLKSWASEKFTNIKDAVSTAWDGLKQKTSDTWGNIKTFLGNTWDKLKSSASEKFNSIKDKLSDAWEDAKKKTAETWENVKKTVGDKLSETSKDASEKFSKLQGEMEGHGKNIISGLTSGIGSMASALKSKIQETAGNVENWFREKLGIHSPSTVFRSLGEYSLEGYSEGLSEGSSLVKNQMNDILVSALKPFDGAGRQFNSIGSEMVSELDSGVNEQVSVVNEMMGQMADMMKEAFSSVADMTKDVFGKIDSSSIAKNLMDGIANGISGSASSVLGKIGSVAKSMVDKFKSTLGIHSPSKVFYGLAEFTMEGFEQGIDSTQNILQQKMSNVASSIGQAFSEEFSESAYLTTPSMNAHKYSVPMNVTTDAIIRDGQIISGIEEAAYRGFLRAQAETSPYLQEIADNTKRTADKDMSVRITDREIVSSYNRGKSRQGYTLNTSNA